MDTEFEESHAAENPQHNSQWVLSYCDLLSQLICFFVLLFAMASLNKEQWVEASKSLSQRLNVNKDAAETKPAGELSIEKETIPMAMELPYLHDILSQKLAAPEFKNIAQLKLLDDRLVISFTGEEAFQKGSTEMRDNMKQGLALVAQFTHTLGNQIEINGNADPTPVQGKAYPSNWELSLARALSVADYLKQQGYPYPINVLGRGDSAYRQLPGTHSLETRDKLSRRIDIIIRSQRVERAGGGQ